MHDASSSASPRSHESLPVQWKGKLRVSGDLGLVRDERRCGIDDRSRVYVQGFEANSSIPDCSS
ncbi:hypothetical protein Dimus_031839, partial [Dionaea muscipula]